MNEPLFDEAFLKKVELLHLVSKKVFAGEVQAARRSKRLGAGIDVRDYRSYAPGDDLRHVDWNYYASARELLVRLFEEEEDLRIHLLLDVSGSMRSGDGLKLRYAKRVAGALAYIGLANLDRVSVMPFADRLLAAQPAARGRAQIWRVFRLIEQEYGDHPTDIRAAMTALVARARRPGLALLISDCCDTKGVASGLDFLRFHRFEPLVLQVFDERDRTPDLRGDVEVVDCETGARVPVTVTPALLRRYAAAFDAMLDETAAWCRQKGVIYLRAPVQIPFDELVLSVFRAGGFLR